MPKKNAVKIFLSIMIIVVLLVGCDSEAMGRKSENAHSNPVSEKIIEWSEYAQYISTSIEDGNVTITGVINKSGFASFFPNLKMVIPSSIDGKSVTGIGELAFESCQNLVSVTIPSSVTDIGMGSFYDCKELKSVYIPSDITNLGDWAFANCLSLKTVNIPKNIDGIGEAVFAGCKSLESITIPENVTYIGEAAFENCASLKSLTIPSSVTNLGKKAFLGCTDLTSVSLGSITSIENMVFLNCSSLTTITIPRSVEIIRDSRDFSSCNNLASIYVDSDNLYYSSDNGILYNKSKTALLACPNAKTGTIVIPSGVERINDEAFSRCKNITTIIIPNSVTLIGNSVFWGCNSLISINVNANNPNYTSDDGILYDKDKTTLIACPGAKTDTIAIPNGVVNIDTGAFKYNSGILSIIMPDGIKTIGEEAFSYCTGIAIITIPESVTSVGRNAFAYWTSIQTIRFPNSYPGNNLYSSQSPFYYCQAAVAYY